MLKTNKDQTAVGIDIVSVPRIKRLLERYPERFPARILAESELKQFRKRGYSVRFLAGRFAIKEALIKSLRSYLSKRPPYEQLAVLNDSDGAPITVLSDELSRKLQNRAFSISISHDGDYACAVALCQPVGEKQ